MRKSEVEKISTLFHIILICDSEMEFKTHYLGFAYLGTRLKAYKLQLLIFCSQNL